MDAGVPAVQWVRLLVAVAVLGGCSGGGDTRPSSVSTSVDYSVPDVMDHTYASKVLFALDQVYGDALRTLARERVVTPAFRDRLGAVYTPAALDYVLPTWEAQAANGLVGLRETPENPGTSVAREVRLDGECMVVGVRRDFRPLRSSLLPIVFVALVPKKGGSRLNPTPWVIAFDGAFATPEGVVPEAPCEAPPR